MSRLSITPVKGCALQHPAEVYLGHGGVAEDRRFYLVDERGRRFSGLRDGQLVRISAHYDSRDDRLSMTFPDGRKVAGAVELGDHVTTDFFGRTVRSRVVTGPWSDALSSYAGRPLRLVKTNEPGDASDTHTVTLLSLASVEELKRRSGLADLDSRRFRMLIEFSGVEPHEEDAWSGRRARIGEAEVRVLGPVPRCAVTQQNPRSGDQDLKTLEMIRDYRGTRGTDIEFGVYGEVEKPGRVAVGNAIEPR